MAVCRTLKNGIRIVTERMPFLHSVAVGVWIKAGSATETTAQNGISHFIEHMLFKGTATRDARELAAAADNVGGQLNAFTAKECTCFHVQVTQEHFRLAMDLLSDMLKNSTLETENLRKEQGVVCEEIAMVEDTPDDLVHDMAAEVYFRDNPLGRNILGTRKNVRSFHAGTIRDYMAAHYTADHIVISIAGNFEEEEALALAEEFFGTGFAPAGTDTQEKPEPFTPVSGVMRVHKPNEQMNLCLCYPGTSLREHEMRYAASLFNAVFGGSMSSRLFQEIREKNGLTYSVFSYPSQYTDYGMFSIYAGMAPQQTGRVLALIDSLIEETKKNLITPEELENAKNQLKGSLVLGLEGSQAIMNRNGKSALLLGEIESIQTLQERIEAVTMDHIAALVEKTFGSGVVCSAFVGNEAYFPKP